jgi:hypothetical protein
MTEFKPFLTKITSTQYWPTHKPMDYTIDGAENGCPGTRIGIGLLGKNKLAQFNLWYWACGKPTPARLHNLQAMTDAVVQMVTAEKIGAIQVAGYPLREWASILTIDEFDNLIRSNPTQATARLRMGMWS